MIKKAYCKLALRSHHDKNKNPQASDVMRMINEAKEGLEYLLWYNDAMKEQEDHPQCQEESLREEEQISKLQEEAEEQNKESEMDVRINKSQQVPEYLQAAKFVLENAKKKECVHMAQKYIKILSDSSS